MKKHWWSRPDRGAVALALEELARKLRTLAREREREGDRLRQGEEWNKDVRMNVYYGSATGLRRAADEAQGLLGRIAAE